MGKKERTRGRFDASYESTPTQQYPNGRVFLREEPKPIDGVTPLTRGPLDLDSDVPIYTPAPGETALTPIAPPKAQAEAPAVTKEKVEKRQEALGLAKVWQDVQAWAAEPGQLPFFPQEQARWKNIAAVSALSGLVGIPAGLAFDAIAESRQQNPVILPPVAPPAPGYGEQ